MSTTAKGSSPHDPPATSTASSAWSRGPPSGSKSSSNIPTPVLTPQPQAEASQAEGNRNAPVSSGNGSVPVAIGSHSRKGSIMVGGGADIKKGSIAFGTVDLDNAGLSSSPAAPSATGTHLADTVKSFGSIDADSATDSTAVKAPKQFDMHASFTGKPKHTTTAPLANPADRRQSTGVGAGGFQQQPGPNGGQLNPHLRPPQQGGAPGQPRSPVLGQAGVSHYNPNQPQIQHGFRAPQVAPGAQGFVRANGSGPQPGMQPGMQRGMGMGAYGMHPGPQGQYPVMNHPYQQQPFFGEYGYPQQQFGMPQWAPHQHPQNQQFNLPPISPRPGAAQPNAAAPSPVPQPAQLPVSRGASPVPTPPSRPGSLLGHQPTPSNVSISSTIPATPARPMIPTTASFTPPTHLSGTATAFTPTRVSKPIKLTRPDGTAVDLKAVATATKAPTPVSSGVATPEAVEEVPKKKVPSLPVMVRLESEAQKEARLAEEARQAHIKELEAKEEEERKARKARQETEKKEREEKEQKEREEKERKDQEQKEKDEKEAKEKDAAQTQAVQAEPAVQSEVKEKADDKIQASSTPGPSTPGSPLASPALAAAGLPAKPVVSTIPRRPVPAALDLKSSPAPSDDQTAPPTSLPSALSTARPIEDLSAIIYPGTLKSPKPELNADAQPGKFRYDREFLMQFMGVCKEKPDSLPPLEEIGLEADSSSGFGSSRGARGARPSMGSGRGGTPTGLGIANMGRQSFPGPGMGSFGMGQFGSTGSLRGTTSEERYNRSRQGNMSRTPSQGGHGLPSMALSTSRSGQNRSRGGTKRAPQSSQLDPDVAPLVISSTSWVKSRPTTDDEGTPAFIERKVKALLNKLTAEKFDVISKQILDWANKSAHETDGMTLKLVIKQIFEKATDEAHWSSMYAKLCRMLLEQLDPAITENFDGKPVSGGLLFRRYLVGRCQVDFENGWKARELAATAAAAKSEEDRERLAQHEKDQEGGESTGEAAMLSDEYYAAQKAKRRGLGLVQLIGELYKLDMLGKGVIRTCFIKLLGNVENPDEEDLESSCKLLATVGKQFEAASPENMEIVFERLNNVINSENVTSRIRFMILDMIDLRKAGWKSKNQATGVMTIAEIHQQAAKEQAERSAAAAQSSRDSMSRGGSRAGSRRDTQPGEWQSVAPNARPLPRAADFSGLGRGVSSAGSSAPNFGPNSVFNRQKGKPVGSTTPPLSRQASTSNMFSALDAMESPAGERRASTDAGEPQRKKLNLQPRSKPIPDGEEGEEDEEVDSPAPAEDGHMSEDKVKSKIDNDMKELWGEKDAGGSRNPEDISEYFGALPDEFKSILAQRLADDVFRISKIKDAEIVAKGWAQSLQAGTVSKDVLVKGLATRMPSLDDDAIDFPQAYKAVALIARAVSLAADEIDELAKKIEVYGEPKITPQMKLERALTAVDEERSQ